MRAGNSVLARKSPFFLSIQKNSAVYRLILHYPDRLCQSVFEISPNFFSFNRQWNPIYCSAARIFYYFLPPKDMELSIKISSPVLTLEIAMHFLSSSQYRSSSKGKLTVWSSHDESSIPFKSSTHFNPSLPSTCKVSKPKTAFAKLFKIPTCCGFPRFV